MHIVCNDAVPFQGGRVFGVKFDYFRQVHGVGRAVDDVGAVVRKGRAGLVGHGVNDTQQRVGESHAGQALGVVHDVPGFHVAVVGFYQVRLDQFDGVDGQRVRIGAVGRGNIGFDGVGHGVHTGVGRQLLGHGMHQVRVHDGDVRRNFKIGDGVFDAFLVIGDDGERRDFRGGAAGGRDGAEVRFRTQFGQAEHLAHIRKGGFRIFVFDPHGFGCVDGAAAAHGHDPVGLEFLHDGRAVHDGFHGRIAFNPFDYFGFHAGFLQISQRPVQKAAAFHAAAAHTDDGPFAFQRFQCFQRALPMVQVAG